MKTNYINNQEKELMNSLDEIDLSQIKNDEENSKLLKKSAKAFVKKEETKMNIRISSSELEKIKAVALQEGLKYQNEISAKDKDVVVIGGGDTGSDCVGNSIRQGAKSVTQIELMSKAPLQRDESMPWPTYPRIFKLSTSQEEGCILDYNILSKSFIKDENGNVTGINCVRIKWEGRNFSEIKGSEFVLKADLVFLAMGFLGPIQDDVIKELNLDTDQRSNIQTNNYQTSVDGIFSAGDCRRGQSLVVWAIHEGRKCARVVDEYLTGQKTMLNCKNKSLCQL
jgi:glutamate synthase (NADPH/NADH) small chain